MTEPLVILEGGRISTLTLNRPARHNALVPELLEQLLEHLETINEDPPAALILRANGRSFSTGGDVGAFHEHRDSIGTYADRLVGLLNRSILGLMQLPCPVFCAVHGAVCGGSLGLLLASDLVLMAEAATITPYYGVVGFSPDGGWTAILPDRIGRERTARILLKNETVTAGLAERWGLATEVADGSVQEAALDAARTAAGMATGSNQRTKVLLSHDLDAVQDRLEAERRLFVEQIQTPQALEGMKRYLS